MKIEPIKILIINDDTKFWTPNPIPVISFPGKSLPSKRLLTDIMFRSPESETNRNLYQAIYQWGTPKSFAIKMVKARKKFRKLISSVNQKEDVGTVYIPEKFYKMGYALLGHLGYPGPEY